MGPEEAESEAVRRDREQGGGVGRTWFGGVQEVVAWTGRPAAGGVRPEAGLVLLPPPLCLCLAPLASTRDGVSVGAEAQAGVWAGAGVWVGRCGRFLPCPRRHAAPRHPDPAPRPLGASDAPV